MSKKKTRTAILTPMQVREAIVEWAARNMSFPLPWDAMCLATGTLKLNSDGSASFKVSAPEKTKEQP